MTCHVKNTNAKPQRPELTREEQDDAENRPASQVTEGHDKEVVREAA